LVWSILPSPNQEAFFSLLYTSLVTFPHQNNITLIVQL
jgi:hypothetical protein